MDALACGRALLRAVLLGAVLPLCKAKIAQGTPWCLSSASIRRAWGTLRCDDRGTEESGIRCRHLPTRRRWTRGLSRRHAVPGHCSTQADHDVCSTVRSAGAELYFLLQYQHVAQITRV